MTINLEDDVLAKQQSSLRYIFKIHSSKIRKSKWDLTLPIEQAMENEEVVALADSATLRFIKEIEGTNNNENVISGIRKEIHRIKRTELNSENKKKIKELYKSLNDLSFVKSYICVIIDNNQDYDRMVSKKGFYVNGIKFERLLATTGGAKNSTVVFVNSDIHEELNKRIDNGRDLTKPLVPAKLEAYRALSCSASIPVSTPRGILVVKDCETSFLSDVIEIDDSKTKKFPKLRVKKNHKVDLVDSDGYGLVLPEQSILWSSELGEDYCPSGMCLRGAFTKGMLFTFDFIDFAKKIANNYIVRDAWGNEKDIRNVSVILTTSMLKLWDSYESIEHYMDCCDKNNYHFSITKSTPKKLEDERNLNYQFIQSLELSDDDIEELIKPTVREYKDVLGLDRNKSLLFLNGMTMNEDSFNGYSTFGKALMIEKEFIKDPFLKNKIYTMLKKKINDAKVGVIKVDGNFSIVSGDPYSLCQSIFGLEVTGILKSGEFYSKYWIEKNVDMAACFRAPMTCHNNIRVLRFKDSVETSYWYKYMGECTIFNSWDTTAHALNGLDKDSDSVLTTNNKIILNAVEELDAILCIQKSSAKKIVTEEDLILSNKNSFGDEIGKVTNRITSMFDVRANFAKGSKEYKSLSYRIQCGQNYQQNAIDKTKGIDSKSMPKEWHDYHAAKCSKDSEIDLRILADKKPYFFTYIYPNLRGLYKKYIKAYEDSCGENFRIDLMELVSKENKSEEEQKFVDTFYRFMPVSISESVMNRICRKIELEFDNHKEKINNTDFDYGLLKTAKRYKKSTYKEVMELYEEYKESIKSHTISRKSDRLTDDESQSARSIFKETFYQKSLAICNDRETLCNIILDLCSHKNSTKQFVWDLVGDQIINNLLVKHNYRISFPIVDPSGDISYGGKSFSEIETTLECEDVNANNN